MKIGLNGRFLINGKLEGIGWFCHEVIQRMTRWYPQHEFIIFFDRPVSKNFIFSENVSLIVVNPPARHPLLWYWWFEHAIPKAIKENNIDIFISMDGFCSLSLEIPQHMVIHDLAYLHFPDQIKWSHKIFYQKYIPKYLAKAVRLYANSNATKEDVVKSLNISSEKIDICFSGCKEMFIPLTTNEKNVVQNKYSNNCPYFVFVGALHPRKNVQGMIQAFDKFKRNNSRNFKLIIVGRKAWMTGIIEKTYNESQSKRDIIFLENLNDKELAKITASAYASISPSFLEGFGVPVLEALYCDVPVLCSNTFSLPEIAGPGAELFDPHNINSIVEAMNRICDETKIETRIELGRNHRTKFSWDKTAKVLCKRIFPENSI